MIKDSVKNYLAHVKLFTRDVRFYLGGTFCMGFSTAVLYLVYNLYLKQLGYGESVMGQVLFFIGLGTVITALPAAMAADRFRLKKVMITASLINGLSMILLAFVSDMRLLYLAAMVAGGGWTVHFVVASPFFMRNSGRTERTHLFGVNFALDWTAGLFGALIGGYIPKLLLSHNVPLISGYRVSLILGAAMALGSAFFYMMIRSPKPPKIRRLNWRKYIQGQSYNLTIKLGAPQFLTGLGAGLVIPFLNIYFANRFQLDSASIGRIFSIGQVFTVIGFLAGPVLAKRFGLLKTVAFSQIASIPFFLVLAFSYYLPGAVIAFWFRGSLMNMSWPLFNNFAMEKVAPEYQAGTNSLMSLFWNISWMLSSFAGGRLIEHYGFTPVMLITIALYISVFFALFAFFRNDFAIGKAESVQVE